MNEICKALIDLDPNVSSCILSSAINAHKNKAVIYIKLAFILNLISSVQKKLSTFPALYGYNLGLFTAEQISFAYWRDPQNYRFINIMKIIDPPGYRRASHINQNQKHPASFPPSFVIEDDVSQVSKLLITNAPLPPKIMDVIAEWGAIKCFKVLLLNGYKCPISVARAVLGGNNEIIQLILENGAKIDEACLEAAALSLNTRIFEWIHKEQDIQLSDKIVFSCAKRGFLKGLFHCKSLLTINHLDAAARMGQTEAVRYILEEGHFSPDVFQNSPALNHALQFGSRETADLLVSYGYNVFSKDEHMRSAVHFAAMGGVIEYLNGDLDTPDAFGATPIAYAVEMGQVNTVRFLLKKKINLSIRYRGKGLVSLAVIMGNLEIFRLLHGRVREDSSKILPLHHAILNNQYEIAKFLVNRKNVNTPAEHKETPLALAVKNANPQIVKLLLDNNANTNIQDENGCTPLDKALKLRSKDKKEIVSLLLEYGADSRICDYNGVF